MVNLPRPKLMCPNARIDYLKALLSRLEYLDMGKRDAALGICQATRNEFEILVLRACFIQWPDYSGDMTYPIPHEIGESNAYMLYENLWDTDTAYGCKRMELLQFCINAITKELSKAYA